MLLLLVFVFAKKGACESIDAWSMDSSSWWSAVVVFAKLSRTEAAHGVVDNVVAHNVLDDFLMFEIVDGLDVGGGGGNVSRERIFHIIIRRLRRWRFSST